MKNGYFRRWSAAACAALVLLSAGLAPAADRMLSGHVPAAVAHLTAISALPPATSLHLAIGLPVHDQAALAKLLQQTYDPTSPNYRHYLTPEQFTEMFGPSETDYQNVLNFARTNGLIVTGFYSNRMVLNVSGAASDIEKAFHVKMRLYQHPTENRKFYAPDAEPTVNASLPILHVEGMNNFTLPRPMLHKVPASAGTPANGSAPDGGYMGQDFRNAYLPGGTLDGSGQIVGLFQFDGYNSSDIRTYENLAGLPNVPLQNILLDGFDGSAGVNNDEVCLDIETSISMAPGISKVVVFEGLYPDSILSSMVSHSEIKQFSASWGYNTDPTTDQLYQQLALQGQTFLNASGDGDAWVPVIHPISYSCLEDTNITLVGGTTLTMSGLGASYVSEKAWNWGFQGNSFSYNWNPDGYVGTSGGTSTDIAIPYWQTNISMAANGGSTTKRNVPDVALTADNVFVVSSGGQTGDFGGTSCASPLFAGFMALVNQQAAGNGKAPIGFLAPQVYALAMTSAYTNIFHDITMGSNTWDQSPTSFYAVAGYDLCTGLGTPNGLNLIYALGGRSPATGFLRASVNPSSGSTLIAGISQTILVTLNNGGLDVTNGTVTATVPGVVTNLAFVNNSTPPGPVYRAALLVPASASALTMTVTASAPNVVGTTNVVYYSAVAVPANDNFASAIKVPAAGGTYQANNRFATIETNEPAHDGDKNDAASLWWSWTPTTTANVLIDTIGSKIDNVLAVYTNATLPTLQSVAATNGSVSQFRPAHVSFNAQAGVTYRIAVASSSSNSLGSLVLNITPGGQLDTVAPSVSMSSIRPLNGLTVTSQGIVISGMAADPTPNASGVSLVIVTANNIDTIATGTTNWVAAIALQPALNIVQIKAVDAAGNVSSPVIVNYNYLVPTVANDFFVNAIQLTNTSGLVSMGNTNASREVGEPDIAGNPGGKSIWWSFTAPVDGVLTLNTTNSTFDTLLGLFTGPNVANLTAIAENDDAYPGAPGGFSFISQAVRSNQLYDIAVDGFDGAAGTVSLRYSFVATNVYNLAANSSSSGAVQLTVTNGLGGIATLPGQSADFAAGSIVVLTAVPYSSVQFANWSGAVTSSVNPLSVAVQTNLNLTANFGLVPYTDGFESGNLSHLTWTTAGNLPWIVQTNVVAQGQWAAQSGIITDSQSSSLILTTNFTAGIGSFDFKVSSETNWDFLKFYVNGVLYHQWSGEVGWANYSFALNGGTNTLAWTYVKDPSISIGLDAAFIDDVNLPLASGAYSGPPPQLQLQIQNDGSFVMTVTGQATGSCVIQISTDLVNWQSVSTNPATGGSIPPIPLPANPTNQALFYRAVAY